MNGKPINMITVLCDARRVQTIAITCRCSHRWTERIPMELHESTMIAQFECEHCHTLYHLRNKVLTRVDKEVNDVRSNQTFANIKTSGNGSEFDA